MAIFGRRKDVVKNESPTLDFSKFEDVFVRAFQKALSSDDSVRKMFREEIREELSLALQTTTKRPQLPSAPTVGSYKEFNFDTLSIKDKRREAQRTRIASLVAEFVTAQGKEVNRQNFGAYYTPFYNDYQAITGYRPNKATRWRYLHETAGSKICTLIDDGHAEQFIKLIEARISQVKGLPRLTLAN